MTFIKYHWFGLLVSCVTGFFVAVFLIVLFAPRQDELHRGFIPCTEKMADEMLSCEDNKKIRCVLGAVIKNSFCDIDVIGAGIKSWVLGQQSAPWSNYYFEPQLSVEDEGVEEYRKTHPDIQAEMQRLHKINRMEEEEIDEGK